MQKLVCNIAGQDCGEPPENAAQVDSDGDGVLDGDDPVPDNADVDGDGLTDGEEIALGSDPRSADTDGDGVSDGEEFENGTDPAHGVLPLTEENAMTPWVRVGLTEDEWNELTEAILDEVNPDGWEGFLFGPTAAGVYLDENGELKLIEIQQIGVNPGQSAPAPRRRRQGADAPPARPPAPRCGCRPPHVRR